MSISQSTLRPFADKLLSSRHQAPDFLFVFEGLELTNKVAERVQDYYLINHLVLETNQNSIPKDDFSMLSRGNFLGFRLVQSKIIRFY